MKNAAPLFAALLLLLPVLYIGSYFALVTPGELGSSYIYQGKYCRVYTSYRCQGWLCVHAFWPLEELDRRLRPAQWEILPRPVIGIELTDFPDRSPATETLDLDPDVEPAQIAPELNPE
jgi:hypothetical protein